MLRKVSYDELLKLYEYHTFNKYTAKAEYKDYQIISFHSSYDTFLECLYKGERKLYIIDYDTLKLNDIYFIGEQGEKVFLKDFERSKDFFRVFAITKYDDTLILHDSEESFNEYIPAGTLLEIDTLCFDNDEVLECNCSHDRIAFWTETINLYIEE